MPILRQTRRTLMTIATVVAVPNDGALGVVIVVVTVVVFVGLVVVGGGGSIRAAVMKWVLGQVGLHVAGQSVMKLPLFKLVMWRFLILPCCAKAHGSEA